jgi:hypothetical protein
MKEKLVCCRFDCFQWLAPLTVIDLPGVSPQGRLAVAAYAARCRSARLKEAIRRVRQSNHLTLSDGYK